MMNQGTNKSGNAANPKREILFESRDSGSYEHIFEHNGQITAYMKCVFDPGNDDETDEAGVALETTQYLEGIAEARKGRPFRMEHRISNMVKYTYLEFYNNTMVVGSKHGYTGNFSISRAVDFDALFLDSFSVIENSELRRRQGRDIKLGPVEKAIVEEVNRSPGLLRNFSHREFEVFIGSLLAHIGFYNIRLSRFVKDGGYDLFAIYCEGNIEYTVVIEVKHYAHNNNAGLEIVDRLNGVRARVSADKSVIFTTSQFTSTARKIYRSEHKRMSLIDFEKLNELLGRCSDQWIKTPSELWMLPTKNRKNKVDTS